MLERLFLFLLSPPTRLRAVGSILFHTGFSICFVGMVLQVSSRIVQVTQKMGNAAVPESTAAHLFPALPTWFIPESIPGFAFWITIVVAGWCCQSYAKDFERTYLR